MKHKRCIYLLIFFITGDILANCHKFAEPDSNQIQSRRIKDLKAQGRAEEVYEDSYSGILGKPGEDYPIYSFIPKTSFSCRDQSFNGIYADPEAQCQVFHMCQPQGFVNSFLCPNGTIFNQKVFVCDWWYNVDCVNSNSFYDLNLNVYSTQVRQVGNDLDTSERGLEGKREPTDRPRTIPSTRRTIDLTPISLKPSVIRDVSKKPVPRGSVTRIPFTNTRNSFRRTQATRTPFRSPPTRPTFPTRPPTSKAPFTRQRSARNQPISDPRAKIKVSNSPPETTNPFIVFPETRLPVNEPNIITAPTPRPISVRSGIAVTDRRNDLRPNPFPIIIPRQRIQISPVGFGNKLNRKVETPHEDSFEDILNLEPVGNDFTSRSGRTSESIDEDIQDILLSFPGPRRLR